MSIGSDFPASKQTFSLSNPAITQTLWNEIARAIMATQRGIGANVGNLAEAWNAKQQDVATLIDERMRFDMGSFTLPNVGGTSPSYADIGQVHTETVTFTSGVFTGFQNEDIRVFCQMVYQRPWYDSSNLAPDAIGSILSSVTTTGFTWKSNAKAMLSTGYTAFWFAVAGGNDGTQGTAGNAKRGWDYW